MAEIDAAARKTALSAGLCGSVLKNYKLQFFYFLFFYFNMKELSFLVGYTKLKFGLFQKYEEKSKSHLVFVTIFFYLPSTIFSFCFHPKNTFFFFGWLSISSLYHTGIQGCIIYSSSVLFAGFARAL